MLYIYIEWKVDEELDVYTTGFPIHDVYKEIEIVIICYWRK